MKISKTETKAIQIYFDQQDGEEERTEIKRKLEKDPVLAIELDKLSFLKRSINNWFENNFVKRDGSKYEANLWQNIENRLKSEELERQKNWIWLERAIDNLSDWFTFYPRELAFAGSIAFMVFLTVVFYGLNNSSTEIVKNKPSTIGLDKRQIEVSHYTTVTDNEFNNGGRRAINEEKIINSKHLAPHSRNTVGDYKNSYAEIHTAALDVDWMQSDHGVSFLNTSGKQTPPVIWISSSKR